MAFDLKDLDSALSASTDSAGDAPHLDLKDDLSDYNLPLDLKGIAQLIVSGAVKCIITMVGAGISTAAGIPDFRSPSTGLYDNLEEYDLDDPMDVFDLSFFKKNPEPFFQVAKKMHHPYAKPTLAHYFIKLLNDKKVLLRHFSQNVDRLERIAGLPETALIEAHGSFQSGHCMQCGHEYNFKFLQCEITVNRIPKCSQESCDGIVKPDIVFFGEDMPSSFNEAVQTDFDKCDLLIIMGTSLKVMPFSGLVNYPHAGVPRLLINRDKIKGWNTSWAGDVNCNTDVFEQGNADDVILHFAELLGWKEDLLNIQKQKDVELEREFGIEWAGASK